MADSERAKLDSVLWPALWAPYRNSAHSLQTQVRHMLIAAMLDGVLPSGTYLPSTRDLAQELDVSRNTVVIVYQQLVDDGYLCASPRVGYWVSEVLPERKTQIETLRPAAAVPGATSPARQAPDWARRMRPVPPEERNIEKPSNWRDFAYPFLYGQFDGRLFPLADWRLCCLRTLNLLESYEWGQDMFLPDDQTLGQQIRTRLLTRRGIQAREDEIIVTIGSQQGLHLLADLLMSDGVRVGLEDPGYPDARNIFRWRGAVLTGLPIDEHGLKISAALHQQSYVYVTPSHQCPTTVTMTLARRYALLREATAHDFVVLEDDYETEDGWSGPATPALKSLDTDGRVIYLGSLSKSLAPGLRIGYIVAPRTLVKALHRLRRLNVRHPSTFGQRALALFVGLGYYNAMLRKLAAAHAERAAVLMQAMHTHLPDWQVNSTDGGSALWIRGPEGLDARALATAAERRGVLIEPGDVFFLEPDKVSGTDAARYLRMGFTSIDARRIDQGVQSLRDAFHEWRDAASRFVRPPEVSRVGA
jgi:GntR family transcriptional regulator/MocR family aminotransferase